MRIISHAFIFSHRLRVTALVTCLMLITTPVIAVDDFNGLGDLAGGGFVSRAFGVSADGGVVVGQGESASGFEAFRWTQVGGMQRVLDWLAAAGVDATGWTY